MLCQDHIHNQFANHAKALGEEITVRQFIHYNYKVLTQTGSSREGWRQEDAVGGDWIQREIRRAQW